ncbi:MAG: SpoIIE family protein phosphatase [Clostridia bacterium]|nr:SpoIIE family protein phosphatase [Clostridia bacterium]
MAKNKLTYSSVLGFLLSAGFSILLCYTLDGVCFLSLPFFIALLYLKVNPVSSAIIFALGFLVKFNPTLLICALISILVTLPFFMILRKKQTRVGGKVIIASVLACLPFIFIPKTEIVYLLIQGAICSLFTPVFISAVRVLYVKKLSFKSDDGEKVCLSVFITCLSLGFISLFGYDAYRSVSIFLILIAMEVFGANSSCVLAVVLALAPSIKSLTLTYFATFSITFLLPSAVMKKSRLLAGFFAVIADLFCAYFLKAYGAFHYTDAIFSSVPVLIYLFIPESAITSLVKMARSLKGRVLTKYAVNRLRGTLAGKLFDVSNVFLEMKDCLNELKQTKSVADEIYIKMADEIVANVCESCPGYLRCKNQGAPDKEEIVKILSVGVSKNRVTLMDLTKKFASSCGFVNSIIFEMNSLITKYREKVKKSTELSSGKELILMQSGGVASVLKSIALDYSKTLSFEDGIEKLVTEKLLLYGVPFIEIMAFSSDDGVEINLVVDESEIDYQKLIKVTSEAVNAFMSITSKTHLSLTHTAITLKPAPCVDASFGLSSTAKYGSEKSGDTHSLIKIDNARFLVALSDGMGSGSLAYNTSKTAISLIESFYKAGLNGNLVINMVNKVLSLGTEDSFSAVDVMTFNLFTLTADFIKIGSPHSYVLTKDTIKIVEGNSLPLGILDELKPTGVSLSLEEGSTVMLISDGVHDAFGSSTDFISFLKGLKTRNPQTLADDVCKKALSLSNGTPKDDMTVICVRIFKKVS